MGGLGSKTERLALYMFQNKCFFWGGGRENLRKMDAKMIRKNNQNATTNHPDAGFLRCGAFWDEGFFRR